LPKEFEMGNARTSNKDVLNAVESQTESIDKLIAVLTAQAQPTADVVGAAETQPTTEGGVNVDPAYMACMTEKAANHATTKGSEVVLYARRNKAGEHKLAYALRERYDDVVSKQPSCIGPVGTFQA
jgi:hypothetical protein